MWRDAPDVCVSPGEGPFESGAGEWGGGTTDAIGFDVLLPMANRKRGVGPCGGELKMGPHCLSYKTFEGKFYLVSSMF
jgi:hypothetical protein